jgi:ABC-2 type transport system ATP-binding protein
MSETTPALELDGVTKRFGDTVAVDDLTLSVPGGSLVGLLGRNGAGKTTSINMATGLIRPSAGRIRVLGIDVEKNPIDVKRRIGVMPQDESLLENLTGPQFLQFVGRIHGLDHGVIGERTTELFDTLELAPAEGAIVREYSYGMKKKLALGAALIHAPQVLFLDEPFEGIDPMISRTIRSILSATRSRGTTIIMSSHVLEIVERLCETIAIIDKGRLVAYGGLEELRGRHGEFATLEELFVGLMGGERPGALSWL